MFVYDVRAQTECYSTHLGKTLALGGNKNDSYNINKLSRAIEARDNDASVLRKYEQYMILCMLIMLKTGKLKYKGVWP